MLGMLFQIHKAKLCQLFYLYPIDQQGSPCCDNLPTVIISYHNKVTPISALQALKIAEAVLLSVKKKIKKKNIPNVPLLVTECARAGFIQIGWLNEDLSRQEKIWTIQITVSPDVWLTFRVCTESGNPVYATFERKNWCSRNKYFRPILIELGNKVTKCKLLI